MEIKPKWIRDIVKRRQLYTQLWQTLAIVPTSWTLFVAFCTVFGVVETLGPFFRALIFHWTSFTRDFWDAVLGVLNLAITLDLNNADKDGLTFALFFLLFGLSALPRFIRVLKAKADDDIRKVYWPLFPIASLVSMAMVSLVASSTTAGGVYSDTAQISLTTQAIVFFVIMALIYFLVAFVPTMTTYIIGFVLTRLGRKHYYIVISPFIFAAYVACWAAWIPDNAGQINIMSSAWVTTIVVSLCLFIPLWMPIIDPKKLIKLFLVSMLIGIIAFLSWGLDTLKIKASIPIYSLNKDEKAQMQTLEKACKGNFVAVFLLMSASQKMNWQQDPMKPCECIAAELVKNNDADHVQQITKDFSQFAKLSEQSMEYYLSRCIPMMKVEK